jgi:flagellar basal body-associated protein FliL
MTYQANKKEGSEMLWTIVVILFVLWLLGMVTSYTIGGLVHALLVLALVVIAFNLFRGRRATG